MINIKSLTKDWYKTGEVAKMINVNPRTIHVYREAGKIKAWLDEENHRWYISRNELIRFLDYRHMLDRSELKVPYIYARVYDDKLMLEHQINRVKGYCARRGISGCEVVSDIGSTFDNNRTGLNKLLTDLHNGLVSHVYVLNTNRLAILGYSVIETVFRNYGVIIEPVEDIDSEEMLELELDVYNYISVRGM